MKCASSSYLSLLLVLVTLSAACFAQSSQVLPGCEPAPELRKALDEKPADKDLDKMKFGDHVARLRGFYEDLIAQYPREVEPYQELIWQTGHIDALQNPGWYPALLDRFRKQAAQNPDDALALYVAGIALYQTDTPESFRLLEAAKGKAPQFPWPDWALAVFYATGLHADKQKSAENLTAFFALCPDSTNHEAQELLDRDAGLQRKVAAALRTRLANETDPARLKDYETLWALEFRVHPVQEHDALRQQVKLDLKRIEALDAKPDSAWLAFLIKGYKQSGAPSETITAMEDRLLREFPHSDDARRIVYVRWRLANPKPGDQKDAAAWAKYHAFYLKSLKDWARDYPDDTYLAHEAWVDSMFYPDSVTEKQATTAIDEFLRYTDIYNSPASAHAQLLSAELLLQYKWQPRRALALLERAKPIFDQDHAAQRANDNLSAKERDGLDERLLESDQEIDGALLQAAQLARQPDAARWVRQSVEAPPPSQEKLQSDYWWNRARLAALEGHKQDALAYYQLSLHTRMEPAEYSKGKFQDDLTDEAKALWKETGGSPAAWAVWSKPPATKGAGITEGRWEKPRVTLPAFELTDVQGKTWQLKNLGGKAVLINVWATWCGPCQEELPKFQKLYEQLQGRADVQLLTLNIDRDLGLVTPYLQQKGYTFPVLPAYSFVNELVDDEAFIPQNWIIDTKGNWLWRQAGYGGEDNWARVMLERLESAKTGN